MNKLIDKILNEIEDCVLSNQYRRIESENIELKDFSFEGNMKWNSVMETVCAFLNTDNGIIIMGIFEDLKNLKYEVKGFNFQHVPSLKEALRLFKDDAEHPKDIMSQIHLEQKELLGKKLMIMYVEALNDESKYIFYKRVAYERLMSGDEPISIFNIEKQKEYKQELIDAKELHTVVNAKLNDLDFNKANKYIQLINDEFHSQNLLTSEEEAIPFFIFNGMYRDNRPTILGMLVCGNNLSHFLNFRCQVDAYVDIPGDLPQNKKIINDNVIPLLEESQRFVFRNIQTGISVEKGGTKTYEYPEQLIRESINNSLAHRDYTIDKYVNINIVPFKHIEIRNPGRFKKQLLIPPDVKYEIPLRRIITNNAKANNPKLAKVLNVFEKWEGKGRGMKNLINACLDGHTDLPYYVFHSPDDLSLFIPKGNLVDERIESILDSYSKFISEKLSGEEITDEQKRIFAYFYKSEIANKNEQWTLLLTKNNNHLNAITSLEEAGLISKHPVSNEIYSVYIVDRVFLKKNFYPELKEIFGKKFDEIKPEHREALNAIYLHKNFSLKNKISANLIGNFIYYKTHEGNIDLKKHDDFKRKVRYLFNKLEEAGFLTAIKGTTAKGNERTIDYELNHKLKETKTLFD